MHYGNISILQVETLESMFAILTEQGWIIPDWIVYLKQFAK